jgi:hypothetical protein
MLQLLYAAALLRSSSDATRNNAQRAARNAQQQAPTSARRPA